MSYCCGMVIFGSVATKDALNWLSEKGPEDVEDLGLVSNYVSGGEPSIFVGEILGTMDECSPVRIDDARGTMKSVDRRSEPFKFSPTSEQFDKAKAKLEALPEELRKLMPGLGTYIVWYSA